MHKTISHRADRVDFVTRRLEFCALSHDRKVEPFKFLAPGAVHGGHNLLGYLGDSFSQAAFARTQSFETVHQGHSPRDAGRHPLAVNNALSDSKVAIRLFE